MARNKTRPNNQQKQADWHRADIKAALEKAGWSQRQLSIANGMNPTAISHVFRIPWPRAQAIIADAIGVDPWIIWPSRYDNQNRPIKRSPVRRPDGVHYTPPVWGTRNSPVSNDT